MSCSSCYQYSVACPFASVHEKVTMLFRAVKPSICSSLLRSHSQGSHQAGSLGKHSYFPRTTAQLPHSTAWDATFPRAFPPPWLYLQGKSHTSLQAYRYRGFAYIPDSQFFSPGCWSLKELQKKKESGVSSNID